MDKDLKKYFSYDKESDSLYIFTKKGTEESAEELIPGVNIEFNKSGNIIGIEILKASRLFQQLNEPDSEKSRVSYQAKEKPQNYRIKKKSSH